MPIPHIFGLALTREGSGKPGPTIKQK